MIRFHSMLVLAALVCWLSAPAAGADLARTDGTWQVTGKTYTAAVDANGNLASLKIRGVEFLAEGKHKKQVYVGGTFPGKAQSIEREGNAITVRGGDVRVRYTFHDAGLSYRSEGGAVQWMLSKNVTACVSKDGVIRPSSSKGDVYKVVAATAALATDQPYHVFWGRLSPSALTRGTKPAEPFQARWTFGVTVAPEELVDLASLNPAGRNPKVTAEYEPGQTPEMTVTLKSLAHRPARLTVNWTVHDHPHNGEQVLAGSEPVTLDPNAETELTLKLPVREPGLYWVRAHLLGRAGESEPRKGKARPLQSATRGFIYDANSYKPPLTRPDDFKAFWDARLAAMRKIPFDANLTPNDDYAIEGYRGFDLVITGHDGKRLHCTLVIPEGPGPFDGEVGGGNRDPKRAKAALRKAKEQPAGVGMWQRGAPRIRIGAALPRQSTYRYWNGREDNNFLHSYLQMVRLADYLRSRDDVRHIWLFGASRTGASMLAAAALAPEQVAAVNVHVPTCCGLSWSDRPYRGWGQPPSRDKAGLATAAYFDPVNFAPDLKVPVVTDGGFYDGLAPAPGILAFCNHAVNAPFRRCAIEQGQHGYFAASRRGQMEQALAEYLKKQGIDPAADGDQKATAK